MADDFDGAYEAAIVPDKVVEEVLVPGEKEAIVDPAVLARAEALNKYSPATIAMALFLKATSAHLKYVAMPLATWPLKIQVKYCSIIGALGGKHVVEEDFGVTVPADVEKCALEDTETLVARLQIRTTPTTGLITDGMLAAFLGTVRGTILEEEDDGVHIILPGGPVVVIAKTGADRGRCIKGGKEAIDHFNTIHKTNYSYEETIQLAREIAFFVCSTSKIVLKPDVADVGDLPPRGSSVIREFVGGLDQEIRGYIGPMRKQLQAFYADRRNRAAIPGNKHLLPYVELIFSRAINRASADLRKSLSTLSDHCAALFHKKREAIVAALNTEHDFGGKRITTNLFNPKFPFEAIAAFANGHCKVAGIAYDSHASILAFVSESRKCVRDHVDLPRKSDTLGVGFVAESISSVPSKIENCMDHLRKMMPKDTSFDRVDAYGTSDNNWWSRTLETKVKDLRYFDLLAKHIPKLGGEFAVKNIENLVAGEGRGRFVFDDTFNAPENKGDTSDNWSKFNGRKKIEAIITAGYEGGFCKMYMGGASDGPVKLTVVPPSIEALLVGFNRVLLVPGGSVHSPEYFLVFYGRRVEGAVPDVWGPPVYNSRAGTYSEGGMREKAPAKEDWLRYIKGWFTLRAMEIVRANLALNLQVQSAHVTDVGLSTILNHPVARRLVLGGYREPAKAFKDNILGAPPPAVTEDDF